MTDQTSSGQTSSGQTSGQGMGRDSDDVAQDVAAAGATDEPTGNLTVEDDPGGTTDPADLAGTGDDGSA
jgi:hypothetical protein